MLEFTQGWRLPGLSFQKAVLSPQRGDNWFPIEARSLPLQMDALTEGPIEDRDPYVDGNGSLQVLALQIQLSCVVLTMFTLPRSK